MSDLLQIESAPQDGGSMLLREQGRVWIGRYFNEETYEFGKLKLSRSGFTDPFRTFTLKQADPSHWLPIPPFDEESRA